MSLWTAFRPRRPRANLQFRLIPMSSTCPLSGWCNNNTRMKKPPPKRNDNNISRWKRISFLFFVLFSKAPVITRRREMKEGLFVGIKGLDLCLLFLRFYFYFGLPVFLVVSSIEATREGKHKGKEINGEDLQQRHNVNTQRYAVLAEERDFGLLVFTISLSLSLCSPHFSSPSFKSLRIRMRFAVLSFSSFPMMAGHLNLSFFSSSFLPLLHFFNHRPRVPWASFMHTRWAWCVEGLIWNL